MASRLMHYIIGNQILNEKCIERDQFILGNIAPDAQDGTSTGKLRSHFRKIIGNEYDIYPNIDLCRFKEKYINSNAVDAFTLGYYCHLISDSVWVKLIYPNYLQFTTDKEKGKKQRELLYSDLSILNEILSDYYDIQFKGNVIIPDKLRVTECSAEGLDQLQENLLEDFNKKHNDKDLKIFNIDFILEYIVTATNQCIEELNSVAICLE